MDRPTDRWTLSAKRARTRSSVRFCVFVLVSQTYSHFVRKWQCFCARLQTAKLRLRVTRPAQPVCIHGVGIDGVVHKCQHPCFAGSHCERRTNGPFHVERCMENPYIISVKCHPVVSSRRSCAMNAIVFAFVFDVRRLRTLRTMCGSNVQKRVCLISWPTLRGISGATAIR